MPEAGDQPAKPARTWRPMILWAAAIIAVLGLLGLAGAAVGGYRQARSVAEAYGNGGRISVEEAMKRLGGPRGAFPKLRLLLHLPERLASATERHAAVYLLSRCGPGAVPELIRFLGDSDPVTRHTAAEALRDMVPPAPEADPALAKALQQAVPGLEQSARDGNGRVRQEAASALKKLRGEAPPKP